MAKKKYWLFILILTSTLLISCSGGKMEEQQKQYNAFNDISASAWERLSKKKIYFGHQSVGFNVMDGVTDLMKGNPDIKLNIVETSDKTAFKVGIFAHSRIGQNVDTISKINDFVRLMDEGLGNTADVAFMKFCYVDINAGTDIHNVFNDYKNNMAKIQKKYPKVTFVHFSVPFRTTKETWKTKLKKLLKKDDIWEYSENKMRNEFNTLLENEYGKSGYLFDIAKIESTYPDGRRAVFTHGDKRYYTLVPEYTNDGGHLNETGRKKIAEQLLLFLVDLK